MQISVEDPSQAFQRIRDYVDASNLRLLPSFAKENLHNGFNKLMAQEAKEKFKINKVIQLFYSDFLFFYLKTNE